MEFTAKIDKILKIKGIKLWELEKLVGMNSTIKKAYEENRELVGSTESRFLEKCRINPQWWKSGTGEIFLPEFDVDVITIPREVWDRMAVDAQRDHDDNVKINRAAWNQIDETLAQQRTLFAELSENYKAMKKTLDELAAASKKNQSVK